MEENIDQHFLDTTNNTEICKICDPNYPHINNSYLNILFLTIIIQVGLKSINFYMIDYICK